MRRILISSLFFILILPSAVFAAEVSRSQIIEGFFKESSDLRISKDIIETYKQSLNDVSLKVIQEATMLAKKDKRKTVLNRDVVQATDNIFRRSPIEVSEIMEKITQLSIIELARLNKQLKNYSDKLLTDNQP